MATATVSAKSSYVANIFFEYSIAAAIRAAASGLMRLSTEVETETDRPVRDPDRSREGSVDRQGDSEESCFLP